MRGLTTVEAVKDGLDEVFQVVLLLEMILRKFIILFQWKGRDPQVHSVTVAQAVFLMKVILTVCLLILKLALKGLFQIYMTN